VIAAGCPLGQAGEPLQVFSPFAEIFGADVQPEPKPELNSSSYYRWIRPFNGKCEDFSEW